MHSSRFLFAVSFVSCVFQLLGIHKVLDKSYAYEIKKTCLTVLTVKDFKVGDTEGRLADFNVDEKKLLASGTCAGS